MFNYSEGYPILEIQPSAGLLRPNVYRSIQGAALYGGDDLEVIDLNSLTDATSYTRSEPKKVNTYNQWYALMNYMMTTEGGLTGVSNWLGFSEEPLKGAVIRQLMGKEPLKPWTYSDDELTEQAIEDDKKNLNRLLDYKIKNSGVAGLEDIDNQIRELTTKITYSVAKKNASEEMGFNLWDLVDASNLFWGFAPGDLVFGDPTLASNTQDIEKRLSTYDPNFNPEQWFATKFSDETAAMAMAENGISVETIRNAPNADYAMYRIMTMLSTSDIQRRMNTYVPSTADKLRLVRDVFVGGMLNNPGEFSLGVTAELTLAGIAGLIGAVAGSAAAPGPGTVAGAAAGVAGGLAVANAALPAGSVFLRLKRVYDAATKTGKALRGVGYAAETLYKMPLGVMPSYVSHYGLIRSTAASFGFGAIQGVVAETARQQREMAFASATLNANPYAQADYDLSLIATSGLESGALFGGVFGLGGGLLRTGVGALRNRISGVMLDADLNVRDRADRSWSLEGTPLGKSIDNFRAKYSKPIIDAPVPEKLAKESIIENTDVTPEKLAAETEARVNRAETREAMDSPEKAKAVPEDPGTRRYVNETIPDYLARVAPHRVVRNIAEFLSSIAKRTVRGTDSKLLPEDLDFGNLSAGDQLRVLLDADKHIEEAKRIETEASGLPKERETVYQELLAQRKQYIKNLKKKLSDLEYKSIIDEWKNKSRRSTESLPKLIATVRDKAKPVAERQAAAQEAALRVLEAAREAAVNENSAEAIRNNLPEEVRLSVDVAVVEQKLNNGVISQATIDNISAELVGRKPTKKTKAKTKLQKAIEEANIIARYDTERLAKVKALIKEPEQFLNLVTGSYDNASRFYDFLVEAVFKGIITDSERLIILASTVHLDFNSKAFSVKWEITELPTYAAGKFNPETNTIQLSSKLNVLNNPKKVAKAILHELGHAYFNNNAVGSVYLNTLKVFNRLHWSEKTKFISLLFEEEGTDPLLQTVTTRLYTVQNIEEFTVDTWAKLTIEENDAIITSLTAVEVSLAQKMLKTLLTNLSLVANVLNSSEYYYSIKKIMDEITSLDEKLDQQISVPKLTKAYSTAIEQARSYKNLTLETFNKLLKDSLPKTNNNNNYLLTQEEFNLFVDEYFQRFGATLNNAAFISFMITKSSGRNILDANGVTKHFKDFIENTKLYTQSQVASNKVKLAYLLSSPAWKFLQGLTKEQRREALEISIFVEDFKDLRKEPKQAIKRLDLVNEKIKELELKQRPKKLEKTKLENYKAEKAELERTIALLELKTKVLLPASYQESAFPFRNLLNKDLFNKLRNLKVSEKSYLSKEELNSLVDLLEKDVWYTESPIELTAIVMNNMELQELSRLTLDIAHKNFYEQLEKEGGLFDIVDSKDFPEWSTPEVATSNLGWMLEAKLTVEQMEQLVSRNIDPTLVMALVNKFKTPSQFVNGVNAVIASGQVVYNPVSKLWEIPKPTKPKKGKKVAKKPEEPEEPEQKKLTKGRTPTVVSDPKVVRSAEEEALKTDSIAVTLENLKDMLVRMASEKLGNDDSINTLFLNPASAENRIEDGEIKTLTDLIKYTHGMNRLAARKEKRNRALLGRLVEKGIIKVSESEKPRIALARDAVGKITEAEKRLTIFEQFAEYNKEFKNKLFTEAEVILLNQLIRFTTNEELAKELGVSVRTAGNRRSALTKKILVIAKEAGIGEDSAAKEVTEALQNYVTKIEETVKTITKPGKQVEDQLKKDNTEPVVIPKNAAEQEEKAAGKMLVDMANEEKLANPNPASVPTATEIPVTPTTTAIVLYRATSEVTGNKPEEVLRPEKQVDALVEGSNKATKEVVEFKPNKPFNIKKKHSDLLPGELDKLKTSLSGFENDAIVFTDGVVVPLESAPAPKVIGKTDIDTQPDQPKQASIVKEGGVTTTKVYVKKPRTQKEADAPVIVKPSTTEAKDTVVIPTERTETELVPTTEAEKVERKTNSDIPLLRSNGMDSNFLVQFVKRYWESKAEAEGPTAFTERLKALWTQFVLVNQFIADANKALLGDNVMERFWAAVDRIALHESKMQKVTEGPSGRKPLTYRQILQKAAEEVSEEGKEFVLPFLPDQVKFVKADAEGNYRLSAKSRKYQAIVSSAGEDIPVPPPSGPAVKQPEAAPVKAELPETPITPETTAQPPKKKPPTIDESLGAQIRASEGGASVLLRLNNLVGAFFGGNDRELKNWWERLMNWTTATTTSASEMGNTLKSGFAAIAFVTRFFDDTKTQTAHLVAAGKSAFGTAMHFRSEEGRLMVSVIREWAKLTAQLGRVAPKAKQQLEMAMYIALHTNKTVDKAELIALGIPEFRAEAIAKQANEVLKRARFANKAIIDLETQSGRIISVDAEGNPLDPNSFAPTQFDHEGLGRLKTKEFEQLVKDLVAARTKRKLNSKFLDRNTMVVLGWLDVRYDEASQTYTLFAPDRTLKASEAVNMFTLETLNKLRIGSIASEGIEGDAAKVFRLMGIADPENYFVMRTDTGFDVFRMPKRIEDLDVNDALKYREAVSGNTAMYTEQWRQRLGGKNLIEKEIREIIKQKTKQFPYNNANQPDSIFKQAFFKLSSEGSGDNVALPIKGLTPEEVMETELTRSVIRTNLAEAYFFFLKGRYFELAFQNQLNKMLGRKDLNVFDVLVYAQTQAENALEAIAKKNGWTQEQQKRVANSIQRGIERLRQEYQFNADTLPMLHNESSNAARVALALMKFKLAPGYGVSALVETVNEIIKQSPNVFTIPKNVITALRFTLLDRRLSKDKMFQSEIGDMIFVLESFRTDLHNRFMGEIGYGAFQADSRIRTRLKGALSNIRSSGELVEGSIRTVEEAGRFMQSIGSLQAITQGTRAIAKPRIQKLIWKYIGASDKFVKLLDILTRPEIADEMDKLRKESVTSKKGEAKLWKRFAGLAREAGILDANEAAMLLKYGLTTKEQVRHLVWAINKVAPNSEGRVDIIQLSEVKYDLLDNPVAGIDPDTLGSAVSAYGHMIEDMITKTAVSELKGLNKITNIDSRSWLGKIWYSLSSWIRSYQDNVIMDYGSRSTVKYLASGIFLYMVTETVIGLFKEWLAGREMEDIVQEMEDDPTRFMMRGIARMPFFGIYNGVLESAVGAVSAATGGTYEYYGVPGMPNGLMAATTSAKETTEDLFTILSMPFVERSPEENIRSISRLTGATSIINRSPVAMPIRTLETNNAFREMEAIQRYLQIIHRDPYPYMNRKKKIPSVSAAPIQFKERNLLLEEQEALKMRQVAEERKKLIPPGGGVDQQGVSGILGDLLGENR